MRDASENSLTRLICIMGKSATAPMLDDRVSTGGEIAMARLQRFALVMLASAASALCLAACTRLGYVPNADPWRNCVIQLSTKDQIERYGDANYLYGGWGGRGYWGGGGWWGH